MGPIKWAGARECRRPRAPAPRPARCV